MFDVPNSVASILRIGERRFGLGYRSQCHRSQCGDWRSRGAAVQSVFRGPTFDVRRWALDVRRSLPFASVLR
ncbi:hypothetical protein QEH52_20245, partial [Coraliomargarita sp. SDUM461003]